MEKRRYLVVYKGILFLFILSFVSIILIQTASARMYLLWNDTEANIPSGWICRSCWIDIGGDLFPDVFQTKYLRINTTAGTGGSATHTHSYTVSTSQSTSTVNVIAGTPNSANVATSNHNHYSLNVTATLSNTSLPITRELLIIEYNSTSLPTTIPQGSIAFWNKSISGGVGSPTGFIYYTPEDNYFIEADSDGLAGTILGQATHNHTNQSVKTGNPSSTTSIPTGVKPAGATATHIHTLTQKLGWYAPVDQSPLYVNLPMIYATSNMAIPAGLIAMFNDTPSTTSWELWNSNIGYYLVGNSTSFNTTGGSATHNHSSQDNLATGTGGALSGITCSISCVTLSSANHDHLVNVSTGNANNVPPYRNVILATYNATAAAPITCWSYKDGEYFIPSGCQCYCTTIVEQLLNLSNCECSTT